MRFFDRAHAPFFSLLAASWVVASVTGCAPGGNPSADSKSMNSAAKMSALPASGPAPVAIEFRAERTAEAGKKTDAPLSDPMPRKIVYSATVDMNTTKFTVATARLVGATKENGGYVAQTSVTGASGETKTGVWKLRVPAERYETFLTAIGNIGEVSNSSSTSDDVSEEFYDTTARLKNKRVEEARLLQHLQSSTGKLSEILTVEREISRVRGEIEQMEGRLRFLSHQADFSTVTVTIHELATLRIKEEHSPSFGTQIGRSFVDSLNNIGGVTKGIVLVAAYLAPWLAILAGIGIPIAYLRRKRK